MAYSSVSKRFLVAYHQAVAGPARSTTFAASSCLDRPLVGRPINVSFDNHFQGEIGVGYSPASDKFLVAYRHFYEPAGPATIQSKTVSAVDGSLGNGGRRHGGRTTPTSPRVAYNSKNNQFLLSWWQGSPGVARSTTAG